MPHPDHDEKRRSDETLLKQMQQGAAPPDLPPPFQSAPAEADDERSMFKRAERPQEEGEPALPDSFTDSESQAEVETESPEQTTDQTELLQKIVTLLENLPNKIGDAVANSLGVNS